MCLSIASYQMHNSGRLTDIEPRKPHGYGFFDRGVEIVLKVRVAVAVDERRASHERHVKLLGSVVHPERIVPVVPAKETKHELVESAPRFRVSVSLQHSR